MKSLIPLPLPSIRVSVVPRNFTEVSSDVSNLKVTNPVYSHTQHVYA